MCYFGWIVFCSSTTSISDWDHLVTTNRAWPYADLRFLSNTCLSGSESRMSDLSGRGTRFNTHWGNILLLDFLFSRCKGYDAKYCHYCQFRLICEKLEWGGSKLLLLYFIPLFDDKTIGDFLKMWAVRVLFKSVNYIRRHIYSVYYQNRKFCRQVHW